MYRLSISPFNWFEKLHLFLKNIQLGNLKIKYIMLDISFLWTKSSNTTWDLKLKIKYLGYMTLTIYNWYIYIEW